MSSEAAVIAPPVPEALPTPEPDTVIRVRGVGKMYRIYDRPQDRLKQMLLWRLGRQYGHEFWALRGVSLDVLRGEAVGIIGRNGSGKSTLLQMIAGTLSPSEGDISVQGRVAALLELGSGFNPEFTGRENVFLNGAILGASQHEMAERFSEIAAFADIGEFIDQPVKMYSSGMIMRLAFAVQAMVEKEVLIVDEALAVGDEAFQRKCMRTLERFREQGGTVLLVTHDAQTIVRHCDRCLFLHMGRQVMLGPSKAVTDIYQRFVLDTPQRQQEILQLIDRQAGASAEELLKHLSEQLRAERPGRERHALEAQLDPTVPQTTEMIYGGGQAEIFDAGMYDERGRPVNVLVAGQRYTWRYRARLHEHARNLNFGMMLRTVDGQAIVGVNTVAEGRRVERGEPGAVFEISFDLQMNLAPNTYYVEAGVVADTDSETGDGRFLQRRLDICAVRVVAPDSRPIFGIAYGQPSTDVRRIA